MSSSDILSVRLWFGAAAIAFMAIAMNAAGWRHKYFIRAMFSAAALMVALAVFWPQIEEWIPDKANYLVTSLSTSRVAWFVMFVVGIGAVLIAARLKMHEAPGNEVFNRDALTHIIGQQFQSTTISLDGNFYDGCAFNNVTFKWEGGREFPCFWRTYHGIYSFACR